jgi:hypothetical protein
MHLDRELKVERELKNPDQAFNFNFIAMNASVQYRLE